MSQFTPTLQLRIFARDLLDLPEKDIILGRENELRKNFSALQVAVDALGDAKPVSSGKTYNSSTEMMTHHTKYRQVITLNFYGDAAYTQAKKFAVLANSQRAYEIQRDGGFSVKQVGAVRDLKFLVGNDYSNRYELEVVVEFNEVVDVETKRIDTLQITTMRS